MARGATGGGGTPEAQSCILQERGFDWGISRTQPIQLPAPPAPWESWGLPPAPLKLQSLLPQVWLVHQLEQRYHTNVRCSAS